MFDRHLKLGMPTVEVLIFILTPSPPPVLLTTVNGTTIYPVAQAKTKQNKRTLESSLTLFPSPFYIKSISKSCQLFLLHNISRIQALLTTSLTPSMVKDPLLFFLDPFKNRLLVSMFLLLTPSTQHSTRYPEGSLHGCKPDYTIPLLQTLQ